MGAASKGFKHFFDGPDMWNVSEQPEPAAQLCMVIQIVDFTNRNISEIQGFEHMGSVVSIQDNVVFIYNDGVLEMCEILKLVGKSVGFVRKDLFMLQ
jgi:hypothetical protein